MTGNNVYIERDNEKNVRVFIDDKEIKNVTDIYFRDYEEDSTISIEFTPESLKFVKK